MNIELNSQKTWLKSTSCYLLLIMMTLNTSINGQTQEIDSLQHQLTIAQNDSTVIEINRVLSNRYYSINRDSSIMYVKEALRLATAINNTYLVAKSQEELGLAYAGNKNYDLGLEYGLKAAENYSLINDTLGLYQLTLTVLGPLYSRIGESNKAQQYMEKALKYFIKIDDKDYIAYAYIVLGKSFQDQLKYPEALDYYNLAINVLKETNYESDPSIRRNMAVVYHNIGKINFKLGDYQKALKSYNKTKEINDQLKQYHAIADNEVSIGSVYRELKEYQDAIKHSLSAYNYGKTNNNLRIINTSSEELYKIYLAINNYKEAVYYQNIFSDTKDSLYAHSRSKTIADLAAKYESDLKEKENTELKATNILQNQRLKNRSILGIIITTFLAISFIGIFFILQMLKKQKNLNNEIKIAKEIAESANSELKKKSDKLEKSTKELEESSKELEKSTHELEKFNNVMLDREMRIIELKKEVNKITTANNTDIPYPEV